VQTKRITKLLSCSKKATLTIREFRNIEILQFIAALMGHHYEKCSKKIFMPAIWLTLWSSRSQFYVGIFIPDASIKMSKI